MLLIVSAPVLIVSVAFILLHAPFERAFDGSAGVSWLQDQGQWAGLAGAGLLVADSLLPVPGLAITVALGRQYGTVTGGIYALAGWVGAGTLLFTATRLIGQSAAARLVGENSLNQLAEFFERRGIIAITMTRVIPVVPEVLFCLAGLAKMSFTRFIGALVAGSVPPAFIFAALGDIGRNDSLKMTVVALLVPVILLGSFRWRR
ncbi:MAG: hypothetical protein Phyf2KO_11330 [Phycisphaerales bacterium]